MTELPCGFSPVSARGKRPVPMWADAFLRDTMDLSAEEVGAYHLILYAMWKRKSCSLPNDPKRLAQIARVGVRSWNSRLSAVILEFFDESDGQISSKKLMKEAAQTELWVTSQHKKKCEACKRGTDKAFLKKPTSDASGAALNLDNPLKYNNVHVTGVSTGDGAAEDTGEKPSQYPNIPTEEIGDGSVREVIKLDDATKTDRERILTLLGADPVTGFFGPTTAMLGRMNDMLIVTKWKDDLGLTIEEILGVIAEVMSRKTDGPPGSFKYFSEPMQRYAGTKTQTALTPIEGTKNETRDRNQRNGPAISSAGRAHETLVAGFEGALSDLRE